GQERLARRLARVEQERDRHVGRREGDPGRALPRVGLGRQPAQKAHLLAAVADPEARDVHAARAAAAPQAGRARDRPAHLAGALARQGQPGAGAVIDPGQPAVLLVAGADQVLPRQRALRLEVEEAVAEVVVADPVAELPLQVDRAGALLDLERREA